MARVDGVLGTRIPFTDMSVGGVAVLLCILVLNVAAVFGCNSSNNFGVATNFGYLALGNAAIIIAPVTRNSFLQLLVRSCHGSFACSCPGGCAV
jgi:hypothetical protein